MRVLLEQTRPAGLTGRALWTLGGQALSSASNFLLTLFVLSTAPAAEFATFAVTVTTYQLLVQLSRALVSVPVLIVHSAQLGSSSVGAGAAPEGDEHRSPTALVVLTGLAAAGALAIAAVAAGPFLPGARVQFVLLAAAIPVLLLQDAARHVAFARGRPAVAATSDAVWVGLQVAASLALFATGEASTPALMAIWCLAGAVAWTWAAAQLRLPPRLAGARTWLRQHGSLCRRVVLETAALSSSYYILYFGLAVVAGAAQLGNLKAAQTMFGPVIVVLLGGISLGVPESVRARRDPGRVKHIAALLSVVLAGVALAVGAMIYVLLPVFGPRWFASSWSSARPLIPLLSVYAAALGASTGPISALRALGRAAWITRMRALAGATLVVCGLTASWAVGAAGALGTLAAVESVVAAASWAELRRVGRASSATSESPP